MSSLYILVFWTQWEQCCPGWAYLVLGLKSYFSKFLLFCVLFLVLFLATPDWKVLILVKMSAQVDLFPHVYEVFCIGDQGGQSCQRRCILRVQLSQAALLSYVLCPRGTRGDSISRCSLLCPHRCCFFILHFRNASHFHPDWSRENSVIFWNFRKFHRLWCVRFSPFFLLALYCKKKKKRLSC